MQDAKVNYFPKERPLLLLGIWIRGSPCVILFMNENLGKGNVFCDLSGWKERVNMAKCITGLNDLATTNPDLVKEWDYEKNTILPTEIKSGSHRKVWWKCEQGHQWFQAISNRLRSNDKGCPYCSGRYAISGVSDFGTKYPNLLEEWNYNKNADTDPYQISPFSNKKVWWKCEKGHEWEASIDARTYKGRNCPFCSNQKVLKGYNDLLSLYPDLAVEWNYDKNLGVTPDQVIAHSGKKYWWKCEKGHEWDATINSRVSGRGCKQCAKEMKTSFPEQAIFYYLRKVFDDVINGYHTNTISEIDIYIPSISTGIEYDGQYYHKDISRDKKKDIVLEQSGILLIRIKENSRLDYAGNDYIEKNNVLYYNPRNKKHLDSVIIRLFQIIGIDERPIINTEKDRAIIWSQYIDRAKDNSLEALYPEIAKEWNYKKNITLTPDKVTSRSGKKVWWKCARCGTEWEAVIAQRTGGTGCPNCASSKISAKVSKLIPGVNDMATLFPELVEEWDYDKNGDITPQNIYYGSTKRVWWKCSSCGCEYATPLSNRTKLQTKCKKCTYSIQRGSLKEKHPELLEEWDYTKNTDLDPALISCGTAKKAWWKCSKCGYEWFSRISHRVSGTKCPRCSHKKTK